MPHTTLVAAVLLAVVPFVVADIVSSLRAGFDSPFWAAPMDDKLPRIVGNRRAWRRLGTMWGPITVLLSAGMAGFTFQLAAAGEAVWAALGLGGFLVGAIGFVVAILFGLIAAEHAAAALKETGITPDWLAPIWEASGLVERGFVIAANLAYVAWGIGIVASGFPAEWAGWVAIATGAALAGWATMNDYAFQHMTLLTPITVATALLLV